MAGEIRRELEEPDRQKPPTAQPPEPAHGRGKVADIAALQISQ